jgi:hypothetical protein
MRKAYQAFHDPGHSWLRVKRSELAELGLLKSVTPFSYEKGEWVYLEEDCDAGLFIDAMKAKGTDLVIMPSHCERCESRIRTYAGFRLREGEE